MSELEILKNGALALLVIALAVLAYALARVPPVEPPSLGHLGLERRRALDKGGLFAAAEPMMRKAAAWFARARLQELRKALELEIQQAGDWLGLRPDELLALCLGGAFGGSALGGFLVRSLGWETYWIAAAAILGAMLPRTRLSARIKDRTTKVTRGLPPTIDLAALCMGAGLDFPGAIRQIVDKSPSKTDPLVDELERILQELELGRTRAQALLAFADRVKSDAVRDFVTAVVQSEEKGTPLAEILEIQAGMLRTHRTVQAEVSAAHAAVVMLLPLMLVFASIILILAGPFALKGLGAGL